MGGAYTYRLRKTPHVAQNFLYSLNVKQILLLATVALALSACGTTTSIPKVEEQGAITLNFYKVNPQGLKQQDVFSDKTTNIRIRVSNPSTGFNVVRDVTPNETANVTFSVPANTGYAVEAISYSNPTRELLKIGTKSAITVNANATNQVSLVLQRPPIQLTIPASVTAGTGFNASVTGVPSNISFSGVYLGGVSSPRATNVANGGTFFPSASSNSSSFNGTYNMTAPLANGSTTMYVYMEFIFYTFGPWRLDSDTDTLLRLWIPSAGMGENTPQATLVTPSSSINIGITY